jgi:DNA-binding transcriptional LysR family regulator
LTAHSCINLRLTIYGGLYAWEFENKGQEVRVCVDGQLVFNGVFQVLDAALAGFEIAYIPEDIAQPHLADDRLRLLFDNSVSLGRDTNAFIRAAIKPCRPLHCWLRNFATENN